jgi:Ca-activated chloride channel family protein
MAIGRILIATILACLIPDSICRAAERVEIVIDNSAAMWGAAGQDLPRAVVLREGLIAFAVTAGARSDGREIGVRTVGGKRDLTEDGACDDTGLLLPFEEVDATTWSEYLADVFPRGRRPLGRAVKAAVDDLSGGSGHGRIVIVASGEDTCHDNLASLITRVTEATNAIDFRVIGLSMDRETSDSLTLVTRTRNATTAGDLLLSLSWAVFPREDRAATPQQLTVQVSREGLPVNSGEITLERGLPDEEWKAPIVDGVAELELPAGRYWGTITSPASRPVEVAGIAHGEIEGTIDIELSAIPPVTLDVAPEHPTAGDHAYIQYWGAPDLPSWVSVAVVGTPLGSYLVRAPTAGRSGTLILRLPDMMRELEARLVTETDLGVLQLLGKSSFQCVQARCSIDAPEKIENGTLMQISWQGPNMTGDHITISRGGEVAAGYEACILAASEGPATLNAPIVPDAYEIRYVTGLGKTLTRKSLEVYEVLATLTAPTELGPGEEFTVEWTGPNEPQDYLSVSVPDSENHAYIDWQPTESGNPLHLRAPRKPGEYEIRYVRSSDGALLARQPLTVATIAVSLRFPAIVEVGTRFEVEWSGTSGRGDFVAITGENTKKGQYLDWSYTNLGSPLSLSAPFKPGQFEVLYISGEDQEILVRAPLMVKR